MEPKLVIQMASLMVTIQEQQTRSPSILHGTTSSSPHGNVLFVFFPCPECYPSLGYCDATHSCFRSCLSVNVSHCDGQNSCQWGLRWYSHWVCHHGLYEYGGLYGLQCSVSLPFVLCCSGYIFSHSNWGKVSDCQSGPGSAQTEHINSGSGREWAEERTGGQG